MKVVLGLDGGGTKTLLRLADAQNRVVREEVGLPSNICSCGRETAAENLRRLIRHALENTPEAVEVEAACIGSAGLLTGTDASFYEEILRETTGCPRVMARDDAVTALYANLEDKPGLSLTAGTGSICLGKNRRNDFARVGGWGHLFSDEGSAYAIAMQALRRSLWGADGRGPSTLLFPLLLQAYDCTCAEELTAIIYRNGEDKQRLAALSPLVDEAAEKGDAVAIAILTDAARELLAMAAAVIRRLDLSDEAEEGFLVYLSGSVLLKSRMVREAFTRGLAASYPRACALPCERDAAWGAVYLAWQLVHNGE